MILIIDSGSFKADWRFISNSNEKQLQTIGLNPLFIEVDSIYNKLKDIESIRQNRDQIQKIFFYGAGCRGEQNKAKINKLMIKIFPNAVVQIESDLLGAAKALYDNQMGIACILGTGSNCGFYDGQKILKQTPSLGYILGDEGSGAYMGKMLLKKYLYGQLPENIADKLEKDYKLNKEKILKYIYQSHFPNRYLARFSEFLINHKHEKTINSIIEYSIEEFFTNHLLKLTEYSSIISFAGSISWFLKDTIELTAEKYELKIDTFLQSPIEKLKKIHEKDIT
jgi:N-acetylglucosamine kinase-like BadF-type ATPase